MKYIGRMLTTVEQVIKELGGARNVAQLVGVSLPAVSNAKKAQHIPHRWRMTLYQEAQRRNVVIAPELIGGEPSAVATPDAERPAA